ncbi:MAG: hypothetical protein EA401_04725, partial [Planctomycetota bacterium]
AQQIETIQAGGTAFAAGPIPQLNPEWLTAANDNSAEWQLACALGSSAAFWKHKEPQDPVRHHWLPLLESKRFWKYHTTDADQRLYHDVRCVVNRRDALADAAAVVERRLIEASQHGSRALRLVAAPGFEAQWKDLSNLLNGSVDLDRTLRLAQALMALNWKQAEKPASPPSNSTTNLPEPAWLALRCCCLAEKLPDGRTIPCDPAMVRRLRAGDAGEALAIALRRLRASGIRPPLQAGNADSNIARLWAAALIFPITPEMAEQAINHLHPAHEGATRA